MKEARSGEGFAPSKGGRPRFAAPVSRSEHFKASYALTTRRTTFKSEHNAGAPHGKR
jgi:hypothetical protein